MLRSPLYPNLLSSITGSTSISLERQFPVLMSALCSPILLALCGVLSSSLETPYADRLKLQTNAFLDAPNSDDAGSLNRSVYLPPSTEFMSKPTWKKKTQNNRGSICHVTSLRYEVTASCHRPTLITCYRQESALVEAWSAHKLHTGVTQASHRLHTGFTQSSRSAPNNQTCSRRIVGTRNGHT